MTLRSLQRQAPCAWQRYGDHAKIRGPDTYLDVLTPVSLTSGQADSALGFL